MKISSSKIDTLDMLHDYILDISQILSVKTKKKEFWCWKILRELLSFVFHHHL